jgi:phage/plasmid primase-like uncharacterized protein
VNTLQEAAQAACENIGVTYLEKPTDGSFHSLDVEGKATRNGAGRIRLYVDGEGGQVWNHVTGNTLQFWAKSDHTFTPAEAAERRQRAKEEQERAEALLVEERAAAATLAVEVWNIALPTANSIYFDRKQVTPTGTIKEIGLDKLAKMIGYHPVAKGKQFTGDMVQIIPVIDGTKTITTIEMIDETGLKAGLKDGLKKGCYWPTKKLPEGDGSELTIGIGEGVATMLTYNEASGHIGIAALSCHNLKAVASYFRSRYPAARIEIVSDVGNGDQSALEAARAVGGYLIKPSFTNGIAGSDINDLHAGSGLQAVKACIEAAAPVTSSPSTTSETSAEKSSLFISIEEMFAVPITPVFCVDGVIEQNTLGELVGESGGGKTFVALDMSVAVATGGSTLNGRWAKQGLVLYLIGEGYTGSPRRIRALLEHQNKKMADLSGIYFSRQTINIEAPDVRAVIAEGKQLVEKHGTPLGLVVVDTLARHLVGDENSATDVGMFISELDRLKAVFPGCVVLIVHHTGHALESKSRGRGSSAIRAALDFEILCSQGTLIFTKMKDFEAPDPIEFKLKPVQVGVDDNGEPITSCIVEYGKKSQNQQQARLSGHEHEALEALVTVCIAEKNIENGQSAGSLEGWRQEYYRMRRLENEEVTQGALKVSFQRVTGTGPQGGGLKDKGIVAFTERGAIPLHLTEQDRIFKAVHTGGTRNIDGTITEHVPVSVEEHGTHTYKVCSDVPSDCPVPEVQILTMEDFEGVTI